MYEHVASLTAHEQLVDEMILNAQVKDHVFGYEHALLTQPRNDHNAPTMEARLPVRPCIFTLATVPLSLGESLREALHVVLKVATVGEELNVGTIDLDAASSLLVEVLLATEGGEAPVLGDDDLLSAGELVLGATESLKSNSAV
jgi:hypothetical protein